MLLTNSRLDPRRHPLPAAAARSGAEPGGTPRAVRADHRAALPARQALARRFISLITIIPTVGVMIGVMTLNIVLAVMTGFEEDLRDRILGFNPHIVLVSATPAPMHDDPTRCVQQVRDTPGVAAAAPFVYGQVMLSSGQSVSGVGGARRAARARRGGGRPQGATSRSGSLDGLGAPSRCRSTDRSATRQGRPTGRRCPAVILGSELAKQLGVARRRSGQRRVAARHRRPPVGLMPQVKRFVRRRHLRLGHVRVRLRRSST